jgi:predicted nucleic acid-binding protein
MVGRFKKQYVIDASFALAYLIPDETSLFVDNVFDQYKEGQVKLISTFLFPFEVLNGMKAAVIRKRLSPKIASKLVMAFLELKIKIEPVDFYKIYQEAMKRKLTVYDASYFYLSKTLKSPLLTFDKQLKKLATMRIYSTSEVK